MNLNFSYDAITKCNVKLIFFLPMKSYYIRKGSQLETILTFDNLNRLSNHVGTPRALPKQINYF